MGGADGHGARLEGAGFAVAPEYRKVRAPAIKAGARFPLGLLELAGGHLARLTVLFELEGELVAFVHRAHARLFNGADVKKHVGSAIIGLNEAIALRGVEPLHCSGRHSLLISCSLRATLYRHAIFKLEKTYA